MFGLTAPLRDRIDAKKTLPKLDAALQWLRIVEFACSVAIMGIFLTFSVGLPHGFTTANHLVVVWALTIVAALYPILLWLSFLYFRTRSKVLFLRVARATDSFIAAPILIALAIVLGDSGLPGKCDELYKFDDRVWRTPGKRSLVMRDDCNSKDRSNECGTGAGQIAGLNKMCRTAKAGFGLTVVAIVVMYIMIMLANLYISLKPLDVLPLSPRPSRTRRNRTSGVQTTPEMGQLPQPRDSLIDPTGEPPPPYTARPGQGESIAVAPTSHPAIERVHSERMAAARITNVDVDVERLAGIVPNYPCVDYNSLEGSSSGGIGIQIGAGSGTQTGTQSASTTVAEASSSQATASTADTSDTADTEVDAEAEGEAEAEAETPRTVHHTTSTTPLIIPPIVGRQEDPTPPS